MHAATDLLKLPSSSVWVYSGLSVCGSSLYVCGWIIQSSTVSLWTMLHVTSPLLYMLLTFPSQGHIQTGQLVQWDARRRPMGFATSW